MMNYFNETKMSETEMNGMFEANTMNTTSYDMNMASSQMMGGCSMQPIIECPQERVCHRYICYEVPHIMPCNTRIINHHIYKHTFMPEYTCSEENVCENVYGPRCR